MSKHKLLLADDSITIQKVVNLTFADEGIEVVAVGDGDTALQKIKESAPDLVMADVNMPGLSGYQICEIIKQNPEMRNIPVILLVGSFEPFDEAEARRVGADDFMTKPFQSIRQLVTKVSELLAGNSQPVPVSFETNSTNDASSTAEVSDPEEFIDTLSNMNAASATASGFSDDDEMIHTDQYNHPAAKTAELNSNYVSEPDRYNFNQEPVYRGIQTVSDFETEPADEFSSNRTQFAGYEQSKNSDGENYSTDHIHQTTEMTENSQNPAVYDFADKTEEPVKADQNQEAEESPAPETNYTESWQPTSLSPAEEIPSPKAASILEFDDFDLLELPPIEPAVTPTNTPSVNIQPEETISSAPAKEDVKPETTTGPEIKEAVENSVSASGLSPEAIEAIAQRVVEKLSEKRFFDKEH